jgi:sugar phosphate isomerase/epimerase
VDEIELLLFESAGIPSKANIRELSELGAEYDLSFNIHLPLDVYLTVESALLRAQAADTLLRVFELTAPLKPSTHTLHLPYFSRTSDADEIQQWQATALDGLNQLLARGIKREGISLETLDYPFNWLYPIVAETDIPICLDVGHVLCHGYALKEALQLFDNKIMIMHLHGVQKKVDHLSLDKLDAQYVDPVLEMLNRFTGIVSLEVFSHDDLMGSLSFIQKHLLIPSQELPEGKTYRCY